MICTMTPADVHAEESLSTLKFAAHAKEIKNCITIIEVTDDATLIRKQREMIKNLRETLHQFEQSDGSVNLANSIRKQQQTIATLSAKYITLQSKYNQLLQALKRSEHSDHTTWDAVKIAQWIVSLDASRF